MLMTHLSESDQRLQLAGGDGRGISRMSLSSQRKVEVLQGLCCFSREDGAHVLTSIADVLPQQAGWNQVHRLTCRDLQMTRNTNGSNNQL